jgi:hypothetical protein
LTCIGQTNTTKNYISLGKLHSIPLNFLAMEAVVVLIEDSKLKELGITVDQIPFLFFYFRGNGAVLACLDHLR